MRLVIRFLNNIGHVSESSMFDDNDEISQPQKVPLSPTHTMKKVASTNFSSICLTEEGLLIPFGGGILGRGNEYYDSNPLPITFYSSIQRSVVDVEAGGDIVVVICNWKEIYIHGYVQSVDGEMRKALSPCLVKHALTLCPRLIAVAKGAGAYSGSGSFAVLGTSLISGGTTLQIYGKKKRAESAESVQEVGFIGRIFKARAEKRELEAESVRRQRQMDNQPPDYPFMNGVDVVDSIYADKPTISLDTKLDVKQIVMGEGLSFSL
jgi:alpha-tubulin suppressor-like RCC1 family protein